jgi:hypothetical protein
MVLFFAGLSGVLLALGWGWALAHNTVRAADVSLTRCMPNANLEAARGVQRVSRPSIALCGMCAPVIGAGLHTYSTYATSRQGVARHS